MVINIKKKTFDYFIAVLRDKSELAKTGIGRSELYKNLYIWFRGWLTKDFGN